MMGFSSFRIIEEFGPKPFKLGKTQDGKVEELS
jgi:hypothetical protein